MGVGSDDDNDAQIIHDGNDAQTSQQLSCRTKASLAQCHRGRNDIAKLAAIDEKDRAALARAILEHNLLPKMARSLQGHKAVRKMLSLFKGSYKYKVAQDQLLAEKEQLMQTRYGRSILRAVDT